MAIILTPGYDFTVSEVPTQQTIKLLLDGMVITNIPRGGINTSLLGIEYGWLTGNTMATLAQEGFVLFDIYGKLWVKTATGVCGIRNPDFGGYESIRFKIGAPTDPALTNPIAVDNFYGSVESLSAANPDFSEVYYRAGTTLITNTVSMHQVTAVSGTHIRVLLTGSRRGTVLFGAGAWPRAGKIGDYALRKSTAAANEWKADEFPALNGDAEGLGTKIGFCGPEEDNDVRCPVWIMGATYMVI